MDQQSLQALLLELRGLDPVSNPNEGLAADSSAPPEDESAASTSDYTAWYEDYVKSTTPASVPSVVQQTPLQASPKPSPAVSGDTHTQPLPSPPDLRKLTYAQALPIISRLAGDATFLEALQELKSSQETFELSLLDERNRAKADLERQLKKAREASVTNGTQYEVERISKLLTATMVKFDTAALSRWDTLMKDQQARLEQLGVPCFYVLKIPDPVAQERQRRVMETLTTLLSDV